MIGLCASDECTGCAGCYNSCPVDAISMVENRWGEIVPDIHPDLCTECGRCVRACPILTPCNLAEPTGCYAAWASDASDALLSSSGGVAAVFAGHIIRSGGLAVGAVLTEALVPQHVIAGTRTCAESFRGSKYVQSEIGLVYREVGEHLDSGARVLFTGTPCQVAGLRGYLGTDHENLITVDIVCHGVPPAAYLHAHVQDILGTDAKGPVRLTFRDDGAFRLRLSDSSKVLYSSGWVRDAYYYSFMKGITYRECCYGCRFATPMRSSDITLGDFWGLDKRSLGVSHDGRVSLILVNSGKGLDYVQEIGGALYREERCVSEAIAGNPQLRCPAKRHPKRARFRAAYPTLGFAGAIRRSGVQAEVRVAAIKDAAPYQTLRAVIHRLSSVFVAFRSGRV